MATPTEIVERQVAAYNARDIDAFVGCYAHDVVVEEIDGTRFVTGIDELRSVYGELFDASPDLHADVTSRVNLGRVVIDVEHIRGINRPNEPSEAQIGVIYHVNADGKIDRVRMFGG